MSRKLIVKKELNRLSELERNLRESPPGSDEEHYTQNRVSSPSSLVTTSVPSAKTSPNPASQVPLRGRSSTSPPDLNQSSDSLRKACSTRSGKSRKSSSPLVRNPTATSPVSTSSHRVPPKFPEPSRKPSPSSARAVRLREKSPYPLARSSSSPVNTTSSNVGVSTNTAQARSTSTKSLSPLARIQDPQTNLLLKKNISSSTKNLTPSPKGLSSMKKLSSSAKNLHLGHESGSASYPPNEKVKLERVLGLTVPSNAALDCDPHTGQVAYPAGCTVVLLNSRKNRQLHVQNASRKTITCVAFSPCGRYLATGECGHQPSVRVWDVSDRSQVAEFQGHKYGISCVAFSPTQKYVVSVGSQHDMIVNVWDWRGGIKVASNKFSSKVKAISFAENGSYFVTVGNRHVKFWYLEVARGSKFKEPVPLTGRSAILGEQRNNYFCDVACGRGDMGDSTFAITKSGLLCEFNNRRLLDKWVELRTSSANCLVAGEEYIFVGCAESIIRCFSPFNLQFITTLPRTHYLGVDVSKGLTISHMATHPNNAKYPDTIAVAFDENNHKVTAVYNDHSMYVWDVKDIKRVGKSHSYLYHSACIWGVETYPSQGEGVKGVMPPGSFITCSSDDTIRVWNIDSGMPSNTLYKRNIYSSELLKILYVDPELGFIKDTDVSPQGGDRNDTSYDSRNGVRCIRVSPDGKHLASGDRGGNIRVHELQFLDELCKIEAHDAEVLSLEYSRPDTGHRFLASASRDRLIHVFAVDQDYSFVQTLDDHSSAITSVRFYQSQGALQMVSCSADRSIIFRSATMTPQNEVWFSRGHNVAGKTTLYDMEVDHGQRHVLTACQDRNIRVYNVNTGKHSKTFKGSIGDDGTLIKVILDQSGIYAATSCTDKNMCIYDYYSGECMAIMFGHSELVTGLRFTSDGKHLITVSGDGCIFLWRMPHDMTQTMTARLAQQAERASKEKRKPQRQSIDNEDFRPATEDMFDQNANEAEEPDYRFSMGQLPLWAKKQMTEPQGPGGGAGDRGVVDMPKGRWAQRLHNNAITFKSHYDTDSVIPFPAREKRAADSESSKDSSLEDSVGVHKQYNTPRRENMLLTKQVTPSKITTKRGSDLDGRNRHHTDESDVSSLRVDDGTTDHDGDIEDCSEHDDESTEPEHSEHLMYYPHNDDTASDFTVNAMDVEELRRSQRRHRKARPERPTDIPLVSVSGSQDSDDDDEVSTPSADTAERNIMSMLSVSTESIDRVGRRENFLKTNYESLEGEAARPEKEVKNKNSISYKFNARNKDSHVSNKREELLKRIEETRKKLQSIGYKSNLRNSKSISDLSNIPEKDTSYMSGNQGNNCECDDNPFHLPVPTASHIPLTGSSNIPELFTRSVPTVVPGVVGSISELVSGSLPRFVTGSVPEIGSSCLSELGSSNADMGVESLGKIGAAIFDGSAVPRDQQRTGKQLLAQLERDLQEFDLLMGCPPSPPEVDTDSLEETLRSLALLTSQETVPKQVYQNRHRGDEDSDSDTVKSETSNFSCDSLEDGENEEEEEEEEEAEPSPEEEAEDTPRHRVFETPNTLPLPRRKRQRWQRLSLEGVSKYRPNDYESDVFPTNEMSTSSHSQVFRTASDTALANSDSSHSDVQTPTNPPYFSVKSPGHTTSSRCMTVPDTTRGLVNQPKETIVVQENDYSNTVSTLTVETHSYRLERSAPVSFSIPQPPAVEQLRRQGRELSPRRQPHKSRVILPPASVGDAEHFPVVQAQPLPPGPPAAVYLPSSQPTLPQGAIPTPGRAHRVLLAKRVTIQQILPSKHGGSGDSGFSSSPGGGSGGLRRACSLSDLTNPGAPRRLLPTPPSAGGKKGGSKSSGKSPGRSHSLSRSSSIGVLNQTGEDNSRSERPMRPTIASMNKMTPRALKRKASLSQAVSTGDIRQFHEDSSSEDASPSEHKNTRSRTHGSDRRSNLPTRAVSERDLTRSNSLSSKSRGESVRGCYTSAASPISRRGLPSSDISRPSSAASTVDMSPEEYPTRDDLSFIDFENMPLSVGVVESVCEWVVEGCERLSQLWWRACSEGGGEEDHHRALRSLLLGAAARATHALTPLTAPNAAPAPSLMNPAPPPPQGTDSKDPRMVAMMQQYTDILVNMVQQKMASHQPPPGPA
ncbi:mitogen-activated protein kinase-binding protein 1-like isoform X3 [Homarus americanus]|uniref:mitogen-activated protein kinase-binding protein 1-like isoform X3 n=1 Tax=Homarus americanus TaxID=6706 RepID=UPI001C4844F9|nr:mitogen-activated protein kinase-binding protein 1-like isoform X3 [Homarus americanus]